jgi:ABC-type multidrug transport system ATPase subunit
VHRLKGRLGALPQDALLPQGDSVGTLLSFYARLTGLPGPEAERQAREALGKVGLAETWALKAGQLSHGMARRVGLAQALLVGKPEVVLLDEPTNGLDPKSAAQVRAFIKEQHAEDTAKSRTVVISSHNLAELEELCDSAAIIDRGRLVVSGTMAEITSQSEEVRFQLLDPPPLDKLQALEHVASAAFDAPHGMLVVRFPKGQVEAEAVIGRVLRVLLEANVRISGVSKGRRLEERVLELT